MKELFFVFFYDFEELFVDVMGFGGDSILYLQYVLQ